MTQPRLLLTSSPHVLGSESIERIMYTVLIALLPAAAVGVYFFGLHALWLMVASMLTAVAAEAIIQLWRKKPVTALDGSALITGLLLALNLPPALPIWMAVLGTAFAVVLGKQIFGGLGANAFNPALLGRAFLAAAFPVHMTTWHVLGGVMADTVTSATPLKLMKMQAVMTPLSKLFLGNVGGSIGETSALAILIGGLFLIIRGVIDWRIPFGYLGTVAVLSAVLGQNPGFHLLAGGLMLGAFFMATDYVTSPVTKLGRWIFAIGAGVIVVVIRLYGGLPEGVSYSILIMNGFTPLINQFAVPRRFGEVKARA